MTVSGGSVTGNTATENGGAVYAGSGSVSVSGGSMAGNSATGTGEATGFGGAVFVDTGSASVSGGVIGTTGTSGSANRAKNGSAVYIKAGTATFSGGSITGNVASAGGAVGVGADSVKLYFSNAPVISGNKLGSGESAPDSNVYLDRDTDAVINTGGMTGGANVGIYVPGEKTADLFRNRGDVGAKFGIFSGSDSTISAFHNDRESNLTAVVDSITKRIYWSSGIKVRVRYLSSFSTLPNGTNGDSKYNSSSYYPSVGNAAISLLADELRGKCSNLSATSVYATAMLADDASFDHYLTNLLWEDGKWKVQRRDGVSKVDLAGKELVIYFSEPAFLSIENNADFPLDISALTVTANNRSLINSSSLTGFGLVFARDGMIQEQLLPVQANAEGKLRLEANGGSISILIPGGRNVPYSLTGSFSGGSGDVRLRRTGVDPTTISAADPVELNGTTLNDSSIYEIIFGDNKAICKIVCDVEDANPGEYVKRTDAPDADGNYEYAFARMRDAVAFAINHGLKTVAVEMLVDYLMPGTDAVAVTDPTAFLSIAFTTALSGEYQYPGTDPERRATISRDVGNIDPLIDITGNVGTSGDADAETFVHIHDLNFDGKNLVGECEGGSVKTKDCRVVVENADFANCVAYNGGAIFISHGTPNNVSPGQTKKYSFPTGYKGDNATLTVTNVNVDNCEARYRFGRSGGGAIWTNAKTFTLSDSHFTNCKSTGKDMQGGAVFHRIEATNKLGSGSKTPYYDESQTKITSCTFTGCMAQAGGGLESDAVDIQLDFCTFTNCSSTMKDGGAINVYIYEEDYNFTSIPSKIKLSGCDFIGCTANRNGGAVRSLAVDTEFENCHFTNTTAKNDNSGNGGGAIYVSNQLAKTTTIKDCTFTGTTTNNGMGGAVYTLSKELTVSGTTMTNCQANGSGNGNGGAIYHNPNNKNNQTGSFTSLTDCNIIGCSAKLSGGGVYTNALNADQSKKLLDGCTIQNCTAQAGPKSSDGRFLGGGGVYVANSNMGYAIVENSKILDCSAPNAYGGGIYSRALHLVLGDDENESETVTISGCVSGKEGGGVYHSRANSTVSLADCTINGCTTAENGGGFYTNNVSTFTVTDSFVKNNTATTGNGGGIMNDTSTMLNLTNSDVSGNKAGGKGGGIYTKKQLTLIRSIIHGNQLTTDIVENAAGVYMQDSTDNKEKLVIGTTGSTSDDSAVRNNTTAIGADSNLRLPSVSSGENKNSVTVNCSLTGYFGVVNAKNVGTRFGTSPNSTTNPVWKPDGFSDQDAVFNSDVDTLHGIIDRTDTTFQKIIWAGPPIAKITDAAGNLLYFKRNGTDPAIFDVLENGLSVRTSAFALLRSVMNNVNSIPLYYENGDPYTGPVYSVKMLVESYELTNQITTVDRADKTIIFTTAGKDDDDGYPLRDATGTRASITRGENVTGSMIAARTNLQMKNILLDGGGVESSEDGAIVRVTGTKDITVELQSTAVLQYGKAPNGGAVAVTNGSFKLDNGLIRFSDAVENGGAVYLNLPAADDEETGFSFVSGDIQQCNAKDGAGVYVAGGVFSMSGGAISGCAASRSGGGVFVADGKTMKMSGGNIGYNMPNTAVTSGGGIAVGGDDARLHFSKQVNISKNTCEASKAVGKICNVEMNLDTNLVINTDGTLFSRAYIGVYVPGNRDDDNPANETSPYSDHGGEGDPFGTFTGGNSSHLYCFVNDRNGLKGGLIANPAPDTIYWIKIFSVEVGKEVSVSENVPDTLKQAAMEQVFTFTVRLWDTEENISGIKVKDIAEEIEAAAAEGEESKYGSIPFVKTEDNPAMIIATISMKSGEKYTAENLPDGLGYDVTEYWTTGYSHIPDDLSQPVNFYEGMTGENKATTDPLINPYVSSVLFRNIQPVCKITKADGTLLYRNSHGTGQKKIAQTPAVYKDLSEAFEAINAINVATLYELDSNRSYSGDCRIEMLVPEYFLPEGLELLTDSRKITLTTAEEEDTSADTAERTAENNFPYSGTGVASVKRASAFKTGSMLTLTSGSDLTLTQVAVDGNLVKASAEGGLVYVSNGGTLTVTNGAKLQNSRTTVGSGITGNGAGVYLASGATMNLSGDPIFGGTDTDGFDYLYNEVGNFKDLILTDKKNGGRDYTVPHQDIYLEESNENAPQSIVITGALSGEDGSIWVWAVSEHHNKTLKPFARLADGVDGGNLKIFRNAQDDETSENNTDSWLYGTDEGDVEGYVYWNGIRGSRRVILRKVKGTDEVSLEGAVFTVYKGDSVYRPKDRDPMQGLVSDANGVFWVGDLPFGTYYIHETDPNDRWFCFVVYDSEPAIAYPNPYIKGPYQFKADALEAGGDMNSEIKQAQDQARQNG